MRDRRAVAAERLAREAQERMRASERLVAESSQVSSKYVELEFEQQGRARQQAEGRAASLEDKLRHTESALEALLNTNRLLLETQAATTSALHEREREMRASEKRAEKQRTADRPKDPRLRARRVGNRFAFLFCLTRVHLGLVSSLPIRTIVF